MGMIKIDILAVRGLGTLEDAVRNIEKDTGHKPDIFNWEWLFADPKTGDLLSSGNSIGVVHARESVHSQCHAYHQGPNLRTSICDTGHGTYRLCRVGHDVHFCRAPVEPRLSAKRLNRP